MTKEEKLVLLQKLREELTLQLTEKEEKDTEALEQKILSLVTQNVVLHDLPLRERSFFIKRLLYGIRGLDILEPLMMDEQITEIMVNGVGQVFVERRGKLEKTPLCFDSQTHLQEVVTGLFSRANKELSLSHPIADLRMADGSRANAVLPPIAPSGPVLTIRKFTGIRPTPNELVRSGCLTEEAMDFLANCVRTRKSLFVCGGTAAGKTTLLNALSSFIPDTERIITIEDSAELQLRNQPNLVSLEARQATSEGRGEITLADLIKTALRMRPDRIIVGEVRGDEAYMLVHAANTGHPGTLSTGHGNSCEDMLVRLANMITGATRLPYTAILQNLASCLNYLVQMKRFADGKRRVSEICRVAGCDDKQVKLERLFVYDEGRDALVRRE